MDVSYNSESSVESFNQQEKEGDVHSARKASEIELSSDEECGPDEKEDENEEASDDEDVILKMPMSGLSGVKRRAQENS
ncbi:hypothetical protein TELCIR_11500 [Teladorsagia circumcincta]|uniref:Uncharacterized protein n=1 Tax=Teladorsagia circumcincta TaxID=45464 RepID=A0A2G9U942_TELCI|nr:hypothetical protein TELCIR_11500 [Teladorsagia circumcincta]